MSIFGELKRRNVFRVGIAYLAAVWVLIQVADVILPNVGAPSWIIQALIFSSALGFPLALVLAWFYELTPEGLKAATDREAVESVAFTGRKIDFVIIGLLVVAVGFLVIDDNVVDDSERSIAILPFNNESAAEENAEFFANGVHDELLVQLGSIASLKVLSRTSVEEYRDSPKNIREIGRELGVATVLEGAVQRSGDRVRISVRLIDAQTHEHLWGENYTRELTVQNIFAIQGEMATSIAAALEATLTPQDVARLNQTPTDSTRAYNFYLSGNEYANRRNERLALQQYQRAVDEDPDFVLAWTALSRMHSLLHFHGADPTEARLGMALEAAQRAFELDPDSPEAHLALGLYYHAGLRDYDRALAEFAIAEQGLRGSAELFALRAFVYRRLGEFEESAASLDRAIELDPRNTDLLLNQAGTFLTLRDYTRTERYLERVLEIMPDNYFAEHRRALIPLLRDGNTAHAAAIDPPADGSPFSLPWFATLYERDYDAAVAYLDNWDMDVLSMTPFYIPKDSYYGMVHRLAGRTDQSENAFRAARTHLAEALEASPDDSRLLLSLGEAMVGLGEIEEGVELARRALSLMPPTRDQLNGPWLQLEAVLRVFAPSGDADAAAETLDEYLSGPGWWSIEGLLPDPRLDRVRDDPSFRAIVDKHSRSTLASEN